MTFRQFVEKHAGESAERIAQKALKLPVQILLPVLVREVEEILRDKVKTLEHNVLKPFLAQINGDMPPVTDEIVQAFRERVAIGDGQRIALLDLTIDQLRQRIAFIETQIMGQRETIAVLENCIRVLKKTKCATMREVLKL